MIKDIPAYCTINGHRDKRGLLSLGLTVCQDGSHNNSSPGIICRKSNNVVQKVTFCV